MVRPWMTIAIGIACSRVAMAAPATDALEKALPSGWSLLMTGSELVVRHDRPCYVVGVHERNAAEPPAAGSGTLVTVELRYRLEPRWTDAQLAAAKVTNDKLAAEIHGLWQRYNLDGVHRSKGKPLPTTPDEKARVEAYEAAEARVAAKLVKLPRCAFGDTSVFDGPDTYAQMSLKLDPPEVTAEAYQVVELMKKFCPPTAR